MGGAPPASIINVLIIQPFMPPSLTQETCGLDFFIKDKDKDNDKDKDKDLMWEGVINIHIQLSLSPLFSFTVVKEFAEVWVMTLKVCKL